MYIGHRQETCSHEEVDDPKSPPPVPNASDGQSNPTSSGIPPSNPKKASD